MGCVYALIAAGLSLIFGLTEIVNCAGSEFLMLRMFLACWLSVLFWLDPLLSAPLCAIALGKERRGCVVSLAEDDEARSPNY